MFHYFSCRILLANLAFWLVSMPVFAQDHDMVFVNNFMPHGVCLNWNTPLLVTMILSNLGIAVAYFAIPAALWYFVRHKKDLPYPWVFKLFGLFITACGLTHLIKILTLYQPFYWIEASIDSFTAIISLITAFVLWPLIPKALQLRSPKDLEKANRQLEEAINRQYQFTAELQAQAEILSLTHDAITVRDWDGTIRFWNPGAQALYGYAASEAVGKNYYSLLNTEFAESKEEISRHLIANGHWDGELVDYSAEGKKIIVSTRLALKRDESGNPRAVLSISTDITEHKRAEQRRIALAEMHRANFELQQFAYIASHDLQEPLRAVAGCLQILEKNYKGKLGQDADQLIAMAVDGAVRMRNLINDLLVLAQVSNRSASLAPVDLSEAVAAAVENLRLRIRETNAQVISKDLPILIADRTQIVQLFQNLISNALKFCDGQQPEINIEAHRDQDDWLISVRDNGIGFDQQYADRVFQPFKRLHSQEQYSGNGMGLAICKRIIERQNGKIWVESKQGEGTTFFFTLPGKKKIEDGSAQT